MTLGTALGFMDMRMLWRQVPTILGRILSELLNNACKYTPEDGEIALSFWSKSDSSKQFELEPPIASPNIITTAKAVRSLCFAQPPWHPSDS